MRAIDCLGVVLHVLRLHGRDQLDPWSNLLKAYRDGDVSSRHAFGPGWQRVDGEPMQDFDVLLFHEQHSWSAIVESGHIWSAHPSTGVWSSPLCRFDKTPDEHWRQSC